MFAVGATIAAGLLLLTNAILAALQGIPAVARTWARVIAIMMASLSIVATLLWLPCYPVWSIVVIALDIVVIWAIATWGRPRV